MLTAYFRNSMMGSEDIQAKNEAHIETADADARAKVEAWTQPSHFGPMKAEGLHPTRPANKNVGYGGY